jgi:integrase
MFNFARIEPNPAGKGAVEYFRETERERFLQPAEIPAFFTALDACPNETIKDYVYLSLWTGGRRSNVQAMRWDQIDLEGATWTIPASTSKSGEAMKIHLPSAALEILKRRAGNDSPWVLPSRGATGHLTEPKTAWKAILTAAGITDLHLHDLRRSLGSWMAASGASLPMIGRQLGHHDTQTTAIYARLNVAPVRQFVDTAVEAIIKAATPPKPRKATK